MTPLITSPKIVAIGGAGIKTAIRLKAGELSGFDFLGIDLAPQEAPFEVCSLAQGALELFGSGGDPEVARRAAEGKQALLEIKLSSANLIFIVAGLGGGTASALTPLVAELAAKTGALVVSFTTLPFAIEGSRRMAQAREAISALRATAATAIALPNDTLSQVAPAGSGASGAMNIADDIITRGIRGLTGMLCAPGLLEFDFVSLKKALLGHGGKTLFSLGEGSGPQALAQAYATLMSFPLLRSNEASRYAEHLTLSVKCSNEFSLHDINAFASQLAEKLGSHGEKVVGAVVEPSWHERVEVMLIGQSDPNSRKKQLLVQSAAETAKAAKQKTPSSAQTELGFNTIADHRGIFENTEPNLYRGEDVDLPTYLRRGVKVVL